MPTFSSPPVLHPKNWAVPVVRIGGVQFQASFGILIAAVGLSILAVLGSTSAGNADLPQVVGVGTLFWISGWLVQSITYLATSRLIRSPASELCLGVLGVEVGPRRWPPRHAILVALATLASLIALGSVYRLVEGGFRFPQIVRSDESFWSTPSLGFSKHDSIWQSGAWLLWVQAVLQLYPLPRTIGRQLIAALTSICARSLELPFQVSVFRRCIVAISILTMGIAIASVVLDIPTRGVPWIVMFGFSLLLWISSQGADLRYSLAGMQTPEAASDSRGSHHRGGADSLELHVKIRESFRRWRRRRRLLTAQRREQGEAIDAQRLDEILTRLHHEGMESLSPEDRRILDRVSENLRRQRMQGSLGDSPSD